LKSTGWDSAKLSNRSLEAWYQNSNNSEAEIFLVGSRSLVIQLMKLNLIDEYQLCVHPVIAGSGLPLFENMNDRTILKLIRLKPLWWCSNALL